MALLKYKDPADGLWKPVPVGGAAAAPPAAGAGLTGGVTSYEVGAGTGVTVAADTVSLDKAYTDTLYSPTTHVHALNDLTDADTVASAPAVGDALVWDGAAWVPSGPAVIVPPTPALITQAARWADGIPRFPDAAARDAAYATIGGPVEGMECWTLAPHKQERLYIDGAWRLIGGQLPRAYIKWDGWSPATGWAKINHAPAHRSFAYGGGTVDATGLVTFTEPGVYIVSASVQFSIVGLTSGMVVGDDTGPSTSFVSDYQTATSNASATASSTVTQVKAVGADLRLYTYQQGGATGAVAEMLIDYMHP